MEKIMNSQNLRSFAYVNDHICKKPIRGVVVWFSGLNWKEMLDEDPGKVLRYADEGILYVVPYNQPWAWMNDQAVAYTDEILDVLFEKYGLDPHTPIVASGMSMGGLGAILYSLRAKRTPVACVANCPACDLVYHYTERPDLPRTLYNAYFREEGSLQQVLERHSPLHLAEKLPRIPYRIFSCEQDQKVDPHRHSVAFVAAMEALGHDIALYSVPDRGHCDLPEEVKAQFADICIRAIK